MSSNIAGHLNLVNTFFSSFLLFFRIFLLFFLLLSWQNEHVKALSRINYKTRLTLRAVKTLLIYTSFWGCGLHVMTICKPLASFVAFLLSASLIYWPIFMSFIAHHLDDEIDKIVSEVQPKEISEDSEIRIALVSAAKLPSFFCFLLGIAFFFLLGGAVCFDYIFTDE